LRFETWCLGGFFGGCNRFFCDLKKVFLGTEIGVFWGFEIRFLSVVIEIFGDFSGAEIGCFERSKIRIEGLQGLNSRVTRCYSNW